MVCSEHDNSAAGVDEYPACDSFEELNLPDDLLRGIYSHGLERPSPIQQRAILPVANGRDIIGQAQAGAGKTTAFLIGTLARIDLNILACQVLILAPARELAVAIRRLANALAEHQQARCYACVGGTSVRVDIENLRAGQHVIVGTPGRVFDMVRRGFLDSGSLRSVVVDEADEVLSRGFREQIESIFQVLNREVQVCCFSATLPQDVILLAEKFLREPLRILLQARELTLHGINQFRVMIEEEDGKFEVLADLFETLPLTQCIIYRNTQQQAVTLVQSLLARGFVVSMAHAGLDHEERQLAMREFRSGSSRILVLTDFLACGVDVAQVSLVINYDIPESMENYLRRIGRGGRFGRKGTAVNFVTGEDVQALGEIERYFSTQIEELPADIADRI